VHRAALQEDELPAFLQRLHSSNEHVITKAALLFTIHTAARTGEVRFAIWKVLVADQQGEMIYPIKMIEIGWSGIWVAWHYVVFGLLFGVVIGWPLSELAGRQSAIEVASKKAKIEYQRYKMDLIEKECRAVGMIRNANAFKIESQKLKGEVNRMQGEIFVMRQSAKEQIQDNEELLRNAISAEKELVKAKAKIRRLTGKSNHRAENPIDGGRKPEYL